MSIYYIDDDGNPRVCHICKSIFHFAGKNGENCPDSFENAQIADVNGVSDKVLEEVLLAELGYSGLIVYGLLDSCCSANVMGLKWKKNFFSKMSPQDRRKIRELKGGTGFKFGGDKPVYSVGKFTFPCTIAGERTTITADVVECDILIFLF